jgi:hypothetical protein
MKISVVFVLFLTFLVGGCSAIVKTAVPQAKQPVPVSGPVINYFYTSPACSTCGNQVSLIWKVTGADNVSIDQGIGLVAVADNLTVSPTSTTTFTLTARSGSLSTSDSTQVTVTPASPTASSLPVIDYFDTTPNVISPGDIITLVWHTTGATTASLDHGIGNVTTAGRYSWMPSDTTLFTLTATNSSGTSTAQVTAQVQVAGAAALFLPKLVSPYTAVQATVGSQFTIAQDSDYSDNYTWTADYYDPSYLKLVSITYVPFSPPYRGVNGQEKFVFQPLKAGDTKLMISYYNISSPIDSLSVYYTVHIRPTY